MITDKLTICGEKDDVQNICDLLAKCTKEMELPKVKLEVYLQNSKCEFLAENKDKILILPFEMKESAPKDTKLITYSLQNSLADISSLNVQKRSDTLCFEILCGAFMNRVFIPYKCKFTQLQVLVCASILHAWELPMKKVVSLLNEFLK